MIDVHMRDIFTKVRSIDDLEILAKSSDSDKQLIEHVHVPVF